jgi:cytochrome c biogenesis protein CcdA
VNIYVLNPGLYLLLSRITAFVHLLYVVFVCLGLIYIYFGFILKLKSIRNIYFRVFHLIAMIIVAIQQYFALNCPLTLLEKKLLILAGKETYSGAFIPHMLHQVHLNIPSQYYLPLYAALSVLFLLSFILIPPKIKRRFV